MDIEIPYKATYRDGGHVPPEKTQKPLPGRMPNGSTQVPPKAPPPPPGWTCWYGGSCPVAARTPIEIRSRAGNQHVGFAGSFRWTNTLTDGDIVSYRLLPELTRRRTDPKHIEPRAVDAPAAEQPEYTGSNVSYYLVDVPSPKRLAPYQAECEDIIEALGLNFAEGCAFKAIWRKAAARQGRVKKGYTDGLYDAEKVEYYGGRMVAQEKRKLAGETK